MIRRILITSFKVKFKIILSKKAHQIIKFSQDDLTVKLLFS